MVTDSKKWLILTIFNVKTMSKPSHLRILRILAGLSLSEASERVGISASQLSLAERGMRQLPEQHVSVFAAIYGVEPDVLAVSGGRIPDWMSDQLRRNPVEATRAARDAFEKYSQENRDSIADQTDA
tara:strand:- start:2128 stop:2508 length:381 start_codon:yes stop_codon:yes gene_type:complete